MRKNEISNRLRRKPAEKWGNRYPWGRWFALDEFVLKQGRDFDGQTHGMVQQLRTAAVKYRVRLRVKVVDDKRIEVTVVERGQ